MWDFVRYRDARLDAKQQRACLRDGWVRLDVLCDWSTRLTQSSPPGYHLALPDVCIHDVADVPSVVSSHLYAELTAWQLWLVLTHLLSPSDVHEANLLQLGFHPVALSSPYRSVSDDPVHESQLWVRVIAGHGRMWESFTHPSFFSLRLAQLPLLARRVSSPGTQPHTTLFPALFWGFCNLCG